MPTTSLKMEKSFLFFLLIFCSSICLNDAVRPRRPFLIQQLLTNKHPPVAASGLNALSSTEITNEIKFDEEKWVKIDEYFPKIQFDDQYQLENPEHDSRRFFYAFGKYPTTSHKLNNETIQRLRKDYENKPFNKIYYHFKLWYNDSTKKCTRSFYVYPETNEIALDKPNKWNDKEFETSIINSEDLENFIENFELYLSALDNCEKSILAIKELIFSYDKVSSITDRNDVKKTESVIELKRKGFLEEPLEDFLYLYGCQKEKSCSFEYENEYEKDKELFRYKSESEVKIEGVSPQDDASGWKIVIPKEQRSLIIKFKSDQLIVFNFEKGKRPKVIKGNNFDFDPQTKNWINKQHADDDEIVFWPKENSETTDAIKLDSDAMKKCFEISYIPAQIENLKIILKSSIYFNYQLYEHHPTSDELPDEAIKFCTSDLFHPHKDDKKVEVFLQITKNHEKKDVTISIKKEESPNNENKDLPMFFPANKISEEKPKKNENDEEIDVWSKTSFPMLKDMANSGRKLGPLKSSQPFNVFTNWLNMIENDRLFSKPMLLEFVSSGKFTLKAFLCDSTSICVQAKHVELKSEDVQENKSQYKILFDPHPNQNSPTIRVQLEITPQDEKIEIKEIKMVNFGNPCEPNVKYSNICQEKSPDGHWKCEQFSGKSWHPANNEDACSCENGFDGVNCDIADECMNSNPCGDGEDVECLNFKDGPECQCTNGQDAIKIFNKKCESLNPVEDHSQPKKMIYTLDIEKIDLDIYDVCVQFPHSKDFTEFKLDIDVNGDVQIIKDLMRKSNAEEKTGFGEFCLSQIFPLQLQSSLKPNDWINNMTVQCTRESIMNSESSWAPKFSNPPLDPAFAIRSIRNKNGLYCFGLDNWDYNYKELFIPKSTKNGSQIWLSTKWFENLSDEYKDEKSRNDFISFKSNDHYTERSEICFSNEKECVEFKTKEDLVRKLQANNNNFRLQWILNINKKPDDGIRIPLEISFFDPCFHDCNKQGECMILDNRHFRCKCDDSHSGEKCQFDAKCSKKQEDVCRNIHGEHKCTKLSEKKYTCQCPQGYEFNQEKEKCGRVKIEKVKNICGTRLNNDGDDSSPKECFLHKITDQMNYLPRNFPEIEFKLEHEDELYYTMTSNSVFKIDQIKNKKDSNWKNSSNTDICLKFRYFLTGNDATLSIQLNDDHESIMDIKGVELLKREKEKKSPDNIEDVAKSMDNMKFFNHEQEICLRTLIGMDKINDLKSISFVPKLESSEDLILLQLIPFRNKNMMIWTENTKTYLSSEPLPFIGKTSDDLEHLNGSKKMSDHDINIQKWPVHFPSQRFIDMDTVKDHTGKVSIKSLKTGTKEFAQIETQWLRRAIDENKAAILGFELSGKFEDYLKQIEIEIIDDQRKQLKNLGKFTTDDWKGHLEIKDEISNETIYKIAMKFQYEDPIDGNTEDVLFKIENFNFGDPCIKTNGEEQKCYNIKNKTDPTIICKRNIGEDRNKIDFQCDCDFEAGSKGKNCSEKNYCKYKHLIVEKEEVNGQEYCKSDEKLAQCLEGEFENTNTNTKYKFLCECTDSKLWFEMEERNCVPISQCLLHPPIDLDRKTCQDKDDRCDCECKPGYEKSEENDDKTSFKCIPKKTCEDGQCPKGMTCLKQGDVAICKCPKGFKRVKKECEPDVCQFPELNPCEQTCSIVEDKEPYFQCQCETEYYTKEENSCKLKNDVPEPCKNCQGLGKVCRKGQCDCLSGFDRQTSPDDSINCVPKEEELKLACPDNKLKIDNTTGKIGCDCTDNEMQKWWIAQGNGTCTLEKTACDKGEIGDETCKNAGGLCLINPKEPYGYNCFCSNGMIFPDGNIEKSSAKIVENKKIQCMPACEIPYYERQCSALGAKCNPVKLYEKLTDPTKNSQQFCDCIPGTFRESDQGTCNQHKNVLAMKMVHTWTTELQKSFEKKWSELETFSPWKKYTYLDLTSEQLEYVDPFNYGLAQQRSLKIIQERMAENKLQQTMKLLIKMDILRQQTRTMMKNFQLIKKPLNLDVVNLTVKPEEPNQYVLDVFLYDLNNFGMVANDSDVIAQHVRCAKIESDDMCIIPYMQVAIIKDSLRSKSFEPCSSKSVDVCMGMSDCRQNKINNGLYFSCECNQTFFHVEERTTFKTDEPLVVMKNERCQSKNLCKKYNCFGDNQECVEKDPIRDPIQPWRWIKEIECGCESGYRRNEKSKLCEAVCNDYICHSGTCKNVGHDGYLCECDADHYGEHCENEHPSNTKWIVPIVILVLLVIGISGAFAYMQKKSSKQSINNNDNNNNHDNNNSDHQQRSSLKTSTSTAIKFETLRPSGKNKKVQQINFGYSPSLESISEQSKHHQVTIFDSSNVQSSSSSSGHPDHLHQDVIQLDSLKSFTSSSSCTSSSSSSASKSCSSSLHGQNCRSEMLTKQVNDDDYYQELNPINKEKSIVNNQPLIARILTERIGMAETTKVVPTSSVELQPLKAQYSKPFKSSPISSSLKTTTTTTKTTTSQPSILRSKPIETITIPGNHHHQSVQPPQHSPSSSASPTADQNQISLNPITSLVVPNNDYHHHHPSQASIIIEPQSTERPKSISEFGKQVASIALRKNHGSYDVHKKQQQNET